MSDSPEQELQAKSLVLRMSAIVTIASFSAAIAAQHFGFSPNYSYCVGSLGVIGAALHLTVRAGILKPKPLEQTKEMNKETLKPKPFWLSMKNKKSEVNK
ncbi:hypothetical protein OTK49_01605 [Vibrio coralliirubri]|uniref:hypothetical protein n=1 Tax=Vibrio coralliirubri TaxID=1516159 RepID=UPI002284A88E|nr:hypothetical protein [Vibrio coralliirubri]MCY9861221.1 hypothetical protein [Vibrio coralliirubri]